MKSVIRVSLIYYHPKRYVTSLYCGNFISNMIKYLHGKHTKNVQNFVTLTKCITILLFFKSNLQHNAFL